MVEYLPSKQAYLFCLKFSASQRHTSFPTPPGASLPSQRSLLI